MLPEGVLETASHEPGVYLMLGGKSEVLYVGKAKDLYKRLSSYARHQAAEHSKTTVMLRLVEKVDTIITKTEKEALILEASLIKKHRPKYNIILRDDKSYPYIKVSLGEKWPRATMTRRKRRDGSRYFGPYSSPSAMWATLRLITALFPLRNCKGEELKKRSRPCLNNQIGKCLAPCAGKADRQVYLENVRKTILLLEGKSKLLVKELQQQMEQAAGELKFEKAATLRDQINALGRTLEKQVIAASHQKDQDIIGFARQDNATAIAILFIREGLLNGSRSFFLQDPYGDDAAILSQILSQFYDGLKQPPKEILLPFSPENHSLHQEHLNDIASEKVYLKLPQRGDGRQLVEMANANALQLFADKEKQKSSWETLQQAMVKKLRLARQPHRVECLDISNTSGKLAVGSLVAFTAGVADKGRYRHFRIRNSDGPDDYGMMREVLQRRLTRGIKEDNLPDLFIVDGGKGQLGVALAVARELGLVDSIDWIGIAKERLEEGEKLYLAGRKNPLILPAHSPVLLHIMRIRDESHRYGITFHRRLRNKKTLSSELDQIAGIGKEKKKRLLKELGSLKNIRQAEPETLVEVQGIGPELAKQIYQHFHPMAGKSEH